MSWLPRKVGGVGATPFGVLEVVVVVEPGDDPVRAARRRPRSATSASWNGKSSTFGSPRSRTNVGQLDRVELKHLAEELEVVHAGRARGGADLRHPEPEERRVRRAAPCRSGSRRPCSARIQSRVDLRQPVHHRRLLGEEVVEPEEVALLEARLRCTSRSRCRRGCGSGATSFSQAGFFAVRSLGEHERRRAACRRLQARERRAAGVARRVEAPCRGSRGTARREYDGRPTAAIDVGGVVDDDVEDRPSARAGARSRRTRRSPASVPRCGSTVVKSRIQ